MRALLAAQGWGLLQDGHGNGRRNVAFTITDLSDVAAPVYVADTGSTQVSSLATSATKPFGLFPGWMEVGSYKLTVEGVTKQVEVVSGRTAGAATPLDDSVTLAKLHSTVKPTGSAAAGDLAVRKLGTGASDAAAGNDSRLSDQRTPTDASVTAAKVNGALKPSGSAAATDESLRRLGTGATHAAAGDDSRFPTAGQKNALAGTNGTPGTGNEYLTKADPAVEKTANKDAANGYAGLSSRLTVINTRPSIDPRGSAYGAIGNNNPADVAADTAGLQAAILAGMVSGRKVTPGEGVYHISAKLGNWTGAGGPATPLLALEGEGFGKTIFKRTADVNFLDVLGATTTTTAVVGSITAGDTTITLGSGQVAAKGIVAGSVINLRSSKLWYTESGSFYGELFVVKSISGDVITVQGYIEEDYAGADSPVVAKYTPGTPYIGGITFQGVSTAGGGAGAVLLNGCRDIDIDVQGRNIDGPTVQTQDCLKGHVLVDSQDSGDVNTGIGGFGYGWNCSGASRDLHGVTRMCVGRHAFTTNGYTSGVPRHISATVYAREMSNAPADTHIAGRFIHFPLIEVHNSYESGAKMRAPDWSIGKLVAVHLGGVALHVSGWAPGGQVDEIFARSVGQKSGGEVGIRLRGDDTVIGSVDMDGVGLEGIMCEAARPRIVGGGRIANPGQKNSSNKRCIATLGAGSETGDSWNGASDVLVLGRTLCESADYGVYEHAAGVVSEANIVARSLATAPTNRAGIELLPRISIASQPAPVLPRFGADVSTGVAPIVNRAQVNRFVPTRDWSLVSIGFIVDAVGGAGDSCEVALLDAAQLLLAVSPPTTGKLNSTGQQKIALTGGPYALKGGTVYYICFLCTSLTAGLKMGWKQSGTTNSMNPYGSAAGTMECGRQSSVPGSTLTGWSPSPSGSVDGPMLLPLET